MMSLGRYCPSPLAHQTLSTFACKNLARIKVQSDFDGLPGLHVLEGALVKAGQQVPVLIDNEGGDPADTIDPCNHSRLNLEIHDVAILRRDHQRIVEVIARQFELRLQTF